MKSYVPYLMMAIDAGRRALAYKPATLDEFLATPIIQDAVCMRLQEMGENLSKIRQNFPDYFERAHSDSWNKLIGLRNIISHGYGEVDMEIVWEILEEHLGTLIAELEELVAD